MRPRLQLVVACLIALALPVLAGDHTPYSARTGLEVARDGARSWAEDARLIYLENDEPLRADGTAARWGYLFYSDGLEQARGYTVRDGKILEAFHLAFDFEAPPLSENWIDSGEALSIAESKAGADYRRDHQGRLEAMMLVRGAFHQKDPDASTWMLVYTSDAEPSLFIVVDAGRKKVVRTWRG